MGLQASGKTTFFRSRFTTTHEHISKDLLRNNKNRARRQAQLIEIALQAGRSLVVDNTNPTVEDRKEIVQIGDRYNAEIIGYYFRSQLAPSLERNQQRQGKARVPDVAIYATLKKLTLPSYAEGFDALFYVCMGENLDFEVRPWHNQEVAHE